MTSPPTTSSSRSSESTSGFKRANAEISSLVPRLTRNSSPMVLPLMVNSSVGPLVTNERPLPNDSNHLSRLKGPSTLTKKRTTPGKSEYGQSVPAAGVDPNPEIQQPVPAIRDQPAALQYLDEIDEAERCEQVDAANHPRGTPAACRPAEVREAGQSAGALKLLEHLVVLEVLVGAQMNRPVDVEVHGMAHERGARRFLARDDEMSVALEAAGLAPGLGLIEIHVRDVAHLEQIADVHVLGGHESPDLADPRLRRA